jgi:DNA-binding CsgD family transcriptional regulator
VATHLRSARAKLGVPTRVALVRALSAERFLETSPIATR